MHLYFSLGVWALFLVVQLEGSCSGVRRREVERMLVLHIGMGHSWRARRCVVLGYGGLMEGESHGSGLLEIDKHHVILQIDVIDKME